MLPERLRTGVEARSGRGFSRDNRRSRTSQRASLEELAGRQVDLPLEHVMKAPGLSQPSILAMAWYGASAVQIFLITTLGKCWFLWFVSSVKLG